MRIVSKFRDYYDSALALGQDTSLTYVRETRTFWDKSPPEFPNETWGELTPDARWARACKLVRIKGDLSSLERRRGGGPEIDEWFRRGGYHQNNIRIGCVLFCGKQYPFYTAPKAVPRLDSTWDYSVQQVYSWEKEFDSLVTPRNIFTERHLGPYREVLEEITGAENAEANLFFRAPVVMFLGSQITVNPCLSQIGFQRVIDPFTTFQEISMFLGGVLGENMDPPSPMTDKEKVISHGFDPKYGFRKPPGNKRKG